jgi:drug/metabolite transporter (DMT)-like permease
MRQSSAPLVTAALTVAALFAFAGNSVVCRIALGGHRIDAATFTAVRLTAGAITLLALVWAGPASRPRRHGSWGSAVALLLYAAPFSFAYMSLSTGVGALLLFGAVQITMLLAACLQGERPSLLQWAGLLTATGGLVFLALPGLAAPPAVAAGLMLLAGVSWAIYSLRGRRTAHPLGDTAMNFALAAPLAAVAPLAWWRVHHADVIGVALAVVSGAVMSGLGYVAWYAAVARLTATRAAVVQLTVPVIAAAGGVIFMGERVTLRLALATVVVLGGVCLTLIGKEPQRGLQVPGPRP